MRLVKRNDEELLSVLDDLGHVKEAQLVILDSLSGEIRALKDEIGPIHKAIIAQAEALEESGQIVQMSLQELKEQRTTIRNADKVPHYNKVDHHTGRTPMERFILHSEAQVNAALAFTDSVKKKFSELLEYFGEDDGMASNEFFGTMKRFLEEFQKSIEHVNREEKKKVRLLGVLSATNSTNFGSRLRIWLLNRNWKRRNSQSQRDRNLTLRQMRKVLRLPRLLLWRLQLHKLLSRKEKNLSRKE